MFKNITAFRFTHPGLSAELIEEGLGKRQFVPCGKTQQVSCGFVPPRGADHGPLVEAIDGQYILKLQFETKKVPSQTIARKVDEMVEHIEKETGRRPGKKQRKELKEQALLELLPAAFSQRSGVLIWIDNEQGMLALDATGSNRCDQAITHLVSAIDGLTLSLIQTQQSPSACMSAWLADGIAPSQFSLDRECELKSPDEMKSTVKYGRHPLDIENVQQHIQTGKVVTKLAMTWNERLSFLLTDAGHVKKLSFLDVVTFENKKAADDAFDADVAISTGELRGMLPALIEALGGELVLTGEPGAIA